MISLRKNAIMALLVCAVQSVAWAASVTELPPLAMDHITSKMPLKDFKALLQSSPALAHHVKNPLLVSNVFRAQFGRDALAQAIRQGIRSFETLTLLRPEPMPPSVLRDALDAAASKNAREILHWLLDSVESLEGAGNGFGGWAVRARDLDMVRRVVALSGTLTMTDARDAISLTLEHQDWALLRDLVARYCSHSSKAECTPLSRTIRAAVVNRDWALLGSLQDISILPGFYRDGLLAAAEQGPIDMVQYLLSRGITDQNDAVLIRAIGHQHLDLTQWLLSLEGTDVNALNGLPLRAAVAGQSADMVKLLLRNGANPVNTIAIESAVRRNDREKLLMMVRASQNVCAVDALKSAIRYGRVDIINDLIAAGADIDDYSVLSTAVAYGHLHVLDILVANGANVRQNNVALMRGAIVTAQEHAIHWLIAHGVALNGNDLLVDAVRSGSLNIVKLCMESGAISRNVIVSAIAMAQQRGRSDIAKYLESNAR